MSFFDKFPAELAEKVENADIFSDVSDDSLALAYVALFGNGLRYCAAWGKWMVWENGRWRPDDTMQAKDLARLVCRVHAKNSTSRKSEKLASAQTIAAVERLARSDRRVAASTEQWDQNLDTLNTPESIVDLVTGEIHPHDPLAYHTKTTAVAPAPVGTPCPLWTSYLYRVTGGDDDLIAYLQRVIGYTLTGSTKEHALFFFYGGGRNGKGVFLNTFSSILGDYATVASMEMFTDSNIPQHSTDLAALRGARMVTAQETEEGRRWPEAKIKTMTGGDPITARFMRQDNFTFQPQFKLLLAGNHKPGLRSVDEAIRSRFRLIPFTVTILEGERDPDLPDKLRAEWPAILRWALDGCMAWREIGLRPPQAVTEATEKYMSDEDSISLWLSECCEKDASSSETSNDLFASWKTWADRAGENPGTQKRLAAALEAKGFEKCRTSQARKYQGIRLKRPDYIDDPRWEVT